MSTRYRTKLLAAALTALSLGAGLTVSASPAVAQGFGHHGGGHGFYGGGHGYGGHGGYYGHGGYGGHHGYGHGHYGYYGGGALAAGLIGGVAFGALAAPAYSYPYGAGYGYAAYDGDGY